MAMVPVPSATLVSIGFSRVTSIIIESIAADDFHSYGQVREVVAVTEEPADLPLSSWRNMPFTRDNWEMIGFAGVRVC